MSDRGALSREDDECSLFSRLGSDSPRPRVKYGGMFCSVEGAFENKTLNFESFSPASQRRAPPTRTPRWDPDYYSDTASACAPPPQPPQQRPGQRAGVGLRRSYEPRQETGLDTEKGRGPARLVLNTLSRVNTSRSSGKREQSASHR
ncbi:unnamed protein product [Boreogadus saida]